MNGASERAMLDVLASPDFNGRTSFGRYRLKQLMARGGDPASQALHGVSGYNPHVLTGMIRRGIVREVFGLSITTPPGLEIVEPTERSPR